MSNNYRFDYVKGLVDSQEFMQRHVKLKKVGMVFTGLCPFHNEKTPSLRVYPAGYNNPDTGPQEYATFNCFGCNAGGDIYEFRKRIENLKSRWEALEAFEKELGIEMDDEEVVHNHLKEQIDRMKVTKERTLSLSEINMMCSSMCRNYLTWVKDNFNDKYKDECLIIDKFYKYFDKSFEERSALEAMTLIEEVQNKLNNRRKMLKEYI